MLLNTLNLAGLIVMTGAMVYPQLTAYLLPKASNNPAPGRPDSLSHWISFAGAGVYLVSLLVAYITMGPGVNGGHGELFNLILVPVFCFHSYRNKGQNQRAAAIVSLIIALAIMVFHSLGSHATTQPGYMPLVSQVIHLFAVSLLSGVLLSVILSPWRGPPHGAHPVGDVLPGIGKLVPVLVIVLMVVIVLTGSILSVTNVHSIAVLDGTLYGQVLKLKIGLVVILSFLVLFELVRKMPSGQMDVSMIGEDQAGRKPWLLWFNGILISACILLTGVMTSLQSPDTAPFLNPQRWQLDAGSYNINVDMRPVAGSTNRIRFEAYLPEALMQSPSTLVSFSLYMPGSQTGMFDVEAVQVSQNSFQGEAMFPGPGDWRLELDILQDGMSRIDTAVDFSIPAQPLVQDLRTYLSLSAILYNKANLLTLMVGLLLVGLYTAMVLRGRKGTIPRWAFVMAILGIGLGIYMTMSVTLVKTYPSTYWNNPVPYTAAVIHSGKVSYMSYCADCHGQNGRGDGPWAVENRGFIPDLGSPHMDVHTDGEIYWWITHGIPSLDMPALPEKTSEQNRWSIIQFVRSLRHGVPPDS